MSRTVEVELFASIRPQGPLGGTVVVATDGTHDADGAVRVGLALAHRDGVSASLLSVVEPLRFADDEGTSATDTERLTRLAIEAREGELGAQRARTHPGRRVWPFTIHVGNRVEEIVALAEHHGASLLVLGLGSHGVMARLCQRETALRVMRVTRTPVLAVPSDAWGVPHSVLAAIDFTASSEDAARAALELLGGAGTLYLAHVTPRVAVPQGDSRGWGEPAATDVAERLEALARRLGVPGGVQIEIVSLHGDPARELIAFANQHRIDMIATGAHGRSAIGRLVLGSVSTTVVRTARCWVLVAPPELPAERAEAPPFIPEAQPIG
jgi:nucleotide-binding universal stress UspA family protein